MSKNKTNKQKHSASQAARTNFVHPVRPFAVTGMMYVDFNVILRIKENNP